MLDERKDGESESIGEQWERADDTGYGKTREMLVKLGHIKPKGSTKVKLPEPTTPGEENNKAEAERLVANLNSSGADVTRLPGRKDQVEIDLSSSNYKPVLSFKGAKVVDGSKNKTDSVAVQTQEPEARSEEVQKVVIIDGREIPVHGFQDNDDPADPYRRNR